MAQKSGIENKVSGIGKQRPKMITVLRAPEPEHSLPLYAPSERFRSERDIKTLN